jgi:predicted DCC family thiol-disulfide oxidoreductase YuxK
MELAKLGTMAAGDAGSAPEHLVLYDGTCGFCDRTVQWILDVDRDERFHFAPIQGPTAAAVRARHPDLPTDLDSVLYVERSAGDERVFVRADAVFRIAERLGRLPGWLRWVRRVPQSVTDLAYRPVARLRHRISRALGQCPVPSAATRSRFLP